MKYIIPYILLFFAIPQCASSQQTHTQNYVLSRTFKQAGASDNNVSLVNIEIQYMDGLGRKVQNIGVKQSPAGTDIVQPVEYDVIGRLAKEYLPYTGAGNGGYHGSATSEVSTWYTANTAGLQKLSSTDLNRPYNEIFYEQALNRSVGQRAPGERSANSSMEYLLNVASEVKRYDYSAGSISSPGFYSAGTLTRVKYKDEQGNETNEYTDKMGQLVCKQVVASGYTYYVYDDMGLLRGVLQPNFQDDNSYTNSAFIYDYDERNRLIKKQIPGAGTVEFVYDKFDRPALSRDANQKARNVWGFTKYDGLNRPVITGEISSNGDRASWVTAINAIGAHHETRNNGVLEGYSLNQTAPVGATIADLYSITFYDDYAFQTPSGLGYTNTYYPANNGSVKGQKTGGRARVLLGNGSAGGWLTSLIYYDAEYRPIQTVRQLHDLGPAATERISTQYKYDLAPVVAEQKTEQTVSSGVNSHVAVYSYDHVDRLLSVKETVAFGAKTKTAFTIAQRYNAVGQLQEKWFHGYSNNARYRRRTDYKNNIRGWLTDSKTVYKQIESSPDLPFYAFSLAYHNGSSNYTNGNIDSIRWRGKDEAAFTAGLILAYDGANRLTGSTGLTVGSNTYAETEGGITYDKNGNIKTLSRSGVVVDNLTYDYTATPGNKLKTISDASGNNTGFRTGSLGDYAYDGNGNMTYDINRQANLTYNYLNLPMKVAIGTKQYVYDYDSGGTKHKYASVNDTVTVKYAGKFEYDGNNILKRVITSEGQVQQVKVVPSPASDTLRFDYFLKDHLGNVRVVFDEAGNILQKNDYYPFGLSVTRDVSLAESTRNHINRYLYNSKELQVGTGFVDYGARTYVPEIARWTTTDPLAEKYLDLSPYNYVANNPIKFIDPFGLDIWINIGNNARVRYENGKLFNEDGSVYKGKNDFLMTVVQNLNKMNSTQIGSIVLSVLSKSKNDYTFLDKMDKDKEGKDMKTMSFSPSANGGGSINAGFMMSKQNSHGTDVEQVAHELFHGFQLEKGEKGTTVNREVGSYLFGRAVSMTLNNGFLGFGKLTKQGQVYDKAMNELLFASKFDPVSYQSAINSFKSGSAVNAEGLYQNFTIKPNDRNPVIKQLFPLYR